MRKEALALLEQQSQRGHIDLFYGDESCVSEEGYVPYGWQFADEDVCIEVARGRKINCFALMSRYNQLFYQTTEQKMTADFIIEQLDQFSLTIDKPTVVVLDNARIHTAHKVKERIRCWQTRGLFIFYLPVYSPHLNLTERPGGGHFGKNRSGGPLKSRWLKPDDYLSADQLFYAVNLALAAVGKELFINFLSIPLILIYSLIYFCLTTYRVGLLMFIISQMVFIGRF